MSNWGALLVTLLVGVIPSFIAYRQAIRVAQDRQKEAQERLKEEGRKAEIEAFQRAKQIYEDGIKLIEEQLKQMREQLDDEREVSQTFRRRVSELEDIVARMRRQMLLAGIDPALEDEKSA